MAGEWKRPSVGPCVADSRRSMRNSFGYSRGLLALLQQQATMGPEAQCPTQ
jgi:hypothetical protein